MSRIFPKTLLDGFMFEARWILYPINVGLLIAALIYLCRFVVETGRLIYHAGDFVLGLNTDESLQLEVVRLIEQSMTESLLILILMGGHQIYIRKFQKQTGPQWLEHIDTVGMKVKVSLAFVGYSSAKLMEDLITNGVTHDQWMKDLVTHLVFLVTLLIIAIVWRIMNFKSATAPCDCS
jgi:uncharacterized protein (TIGR00645 family)